MASDVKTVGVVEALSRGNDSRDILREALLLRGDAQAELFALARQRREEAFPSGEVEVRSVVEISNICQQRCNYCAIGGGERGAYVIEKETFMDVTELLHERGRRVVLVQSGENDETDYVDHVCDCVSELKQRHPDIVLILCLGNMSRSQYQQLFDAGAERYVLKFETSNADLYHQLKPRDTLERRLQCMQDLIDIGFQLGSGNMVSLPGQTLDDMVEDLRVLGRFNLAMSSCTPFIPGEGTMYADEPIGDVHLALNTMAIARILHKDRLIPTTSSLETAMPGGQLMGLMAGANTVTIHDGTPDQCRENFPIYSAHRFTPREAYLRGIVEKAQLRLAEGALR